jgi:hypothetical protein
MGSFEELMSVSRIVVFGCGMTCLWACSSSADDPDSCGPPHPTFRLVVEAQDEFIPEDIRIRVRSGGGEEEFNAAEKEASPKVVFCELVHEQGDGEQVGPIASVQCDLWTDGAATVWVNAHGYVEVMKDLEAEKDQKCGLKLTKETITIQQEIP